MSTHVPSRGAQALIGACTLLLAGALAWGARDISSEAGYAGVSPGFLPWVLSAVLLVCGVLLLYEALSGGFRGLDAPSGADRGDWRALAWVAGGIVVDALLIERAGFVVAGTLCYALAVHGLRSAEGRPWGGPGKVVLDLVTGLLIAAPVFWLFTKVLQVSLPGLTGTGWL